MSESTFRIVELAVKLLVAVLATYVVPVAARWIRQQLIQTEIGKAVLAAQQTLWQQSGEVRKDFAMRLARAALDDLHISMSDDQLSTLIEAAVLELHRSYPETEDKENGHSADN